MKERLFKWALKALARVSETLAQFILDWFKRDGAALAFEWAATAYSYVDQARHLTPTRLNLPIGCETAELNAARRQWVFGKLREIAGSGAKAVGDSVLNAAIEIALQKLKG